jgi:ribosome-associated translation inhibitor RaiA
MKLLDKIVDVLIRYLVKYRNKRKLKELRDRDPFIYH